MADEIKNTKPVEGFVTKSIQDPSFQAPLQPVSASSGGVMGFYRSNKIYFWAILVGAAIIGVLAYFAFKKTPPAPTREANVDISVSVPEQVKSGGEAVFKITVQNNDNEKLVGLELELAYPEGVAYESSSPKAANFSGSLFSVPDLISGQNAAIFVKTRVSGNVSDEKVLNIKLHYKYWNFNSEFIKQQISRVTLTASDVSIELEGPSNTNNSQLALYTVKYKNDSDEDLRSARVKLTYPEGFVFASASPSPSLGSDTWDIGSLAKGGSGAIQVQGSFSGANAGETKTMGALFLVLGNDGQFVVQNSSDFNTTISTLPLMVSQELSPENKARVVAPGDNLNFKIRYQNNAGTVAKGVNIAVALDSKAVDFSSLRAEGGQIGSNSIIWNAASVPNLESLDPNESGELSFSLRLNNPATRDSSKNLGVVSSVKIKSNEYESYFPGNQLVLKVSSPATVGRSLSFASGQLPPQVGKTTTYKVRFSLTNSSNDFGGGVLTAFVPLSGGFASSSVTPSESGNVQFDPGSGKLTWNVGILPANTGRFGPARVLEFQVTFTASSAHANTSPELVNTIRFSAKDLFTFQDINLTADDLRTNDLQGSDGFNSGTVQP